MTSSMYLLLRQNFFLLLFFLVEGHFLIIKTAINHKQVRFISLGSVSFGDEMHRYLTGRFRSACQ